MVTMTMGSLPSLGSWEWYAHTAYYAHQKADFEQAIARLTKALTIAPKEWRYQLLRNRGQAYQHIHKWDEALVDFWNMKHRDGRELASHIYLLRGDYRTGLALNEERVIKEQPNWDPSRTACDISGKHVELFEEGGYGDTIQMLRFIPYVKSIAASVTFKPRAPLAALLGPSTTTGLKSERLQVAMFDLMTIAGMREKGEAVLTGESYLKTNREPVKWLTNTIGINWRGDNRHMTDPWRDVSFEHLLTLVAKHKRSQFVSLQHGPTYEEKKTLAAHGVVDYGSKITDFSRAAQYLSGLDAFITMDSAPAHLAGALGVKTYLMHAPRYEYRWGFKETTPWYNSMTIFRGKKYGEWSDVIDAISLRLKG